MNLKRLQVKDYLNRILKEKLQGGVFPAPSYIYGKAEELIRSGSIGKPFFSPRKTIPRTSFDLKAHNENIEEIHRDLKLCYESIERSFRDKINNYIHLESEAVKIENLLDKESTIIKDRKYTSESSEIKHIHTENLVDLENIDIVNTDSDLRDGHVEIMTNKLENNIVDISQENIKISYSDTIERIAGDLVEVGDKENLIDGKENTYWGLRIKSKTKDKYGIEINLIFDNPIKANKLILGVTSPKMPSVDIKYSYDFGSNWYTLGFEKSNIITSNFKSRYMTNIKISMD